MKKMAFGVGLAVTSIFGLGEGAAAQQVPERCETIYDETQFDTSSLLREQIGVFADAGVNVHVQIVEDGLDYGIDGYDIYDYDDYGAEDTSRFRENIEAQCNWRGNRINIIFDASTGIYDVQDFGKTENAIKNSTWDNAIAELEQDLSDAGIPVQVAIARFLESVNPYDQDNKPQLPLDTPSSEATQNTPSKQRDIPWKALGAGTMGLLLAGVTGTRIYAGKKIARIVSDVTDEITKSDQDISTVTVEKMISALGALNKDDAPEIIERWEAALQIAGQLNDVMAELQKVYKTEAKIFGWPSIKNVENAASDAQSRAVSANQLTAELDHDLKMIQEARSVIDGSVITFGEKIDKLKTAKATLQQQGWNVDNYDTLIAEYELKLQAVLELRSDKYLFKPLSIINESEALIDELTHSIVALPERLKVAENKLTRWLTAKTELERLKASTITRLQILASNYNPSCLVNLEDVESELTNVYAKLASTVSSLDDAIGENSSETRKSAAVVESAEEHFVVLEKLQQQVNTLAGTVETRIKKLEELKSTLPNTFASLKSQAATIAEYIEANNFDIDQSTKALLTKLQSDIALFGEPNQVFKSEKPSYLKLEQDLRTLVEDAEKLKQQAHNDKSEMDQLRISVTTLSESAETELNALLSDDLNDQGVSEATRLRARNLQHIVADPSLPRTALKAQEKALQSLRSEISNIKAAAIADVRREQERIKELERREKAAEAAAVREANRRRRTASYGGGAILSGTSSSRRTTSRPRTSSGGGGRRTTGRAGGSGGRKSGGRVNRK